MDKVKEALDAATEYVDMEIRCKGEGKRNTKLRDAIDTIRESFATLEAQVAAAEADTARLDYIERTFSGMTNRERYLPVTMIWGKGSNGRTLREACDKYMKRDAAIAQGAGHE